MSMASPPRDLMDHPFFLVRWAATLYLFAKLAMIMAGATIALGAVGLGLQFIGDGTVRALGGNPSRPVVSDQDQGTGCGIQIRGEDVCD